MQLWTHGHVHHSQGAATSSTHHLTGVLAILANAGGTGGDPGLSRVTLLSQVPELHTLRASQTQWLLQIR